MSGYSVVIPARDAARTLGRVLDSLAAQEPAPLEVIVVDDGSTDATASVAEERGARVLSTGGGLFAGGARNVGWDEADGDAVVFLDADVVPAPGWGAGVARALAEFPGALVGCARTFDAETPWGWVCHLQVETPYLPRGSRASDVPLGLLPARAADARCAGTRATAARTRSSARMRSRPACGSCSTRASRLPTSTSGVPSATCGASSGGSRTASRGRPARAERGTRTLRRVPLHYFALLRLPVVYRRIADDPRLRARFLSLLPRLALAEWTLGASAVRYAARPPALRGGPQPRFE